MRTEYLLRLLSAAKKRIDEYPADEPGSIAAHTDASEILTLVLRSPDHALRVLRKAMP